MNDMQMPVTLQTGFSKMSIEDAMDSSPQGIVCPQHSV